MFYHLEITRFHSNVINENRAKDDPSDRQESISRAVSGRGKGQLRRHSINENRDGKRRQKPRNCTPVRLQVGESKESQQKNYRY